MTSDRHGPSIADVIVVGAGPAGSTAARALATAGARVTILEKYRFPRQKPCGGAISLRALSRFPYLPAALPRISTHRISRLSLEGPAGASTIVGSTDPAVLTIRRLEFDELLVRLACEAGADLLEGVEVTQALLEEGIVRLVDRRGRFYRAPFVIAADGVNSVVARRLGLNAGWPAAHLALDMMEETPNEELRAADPGAIWVSYCPGGSHGYAYVFPKRDHVNVGTGYVLSYFREQTAEKPYAMQRQLVEGLASRGILVGSSSRRHFMPYLIPVGGPLPNTGLARVLLVGDAGGFVNGYTAEGIYYAMVTGELAGQALMDSGHSPLARYTSAWRREVGAELRDAVVVQRYLFGASTRVDRVVAGARLEPDAARVLIDYAVGALSYREARGQFFRRFPTLPLRLAWALLADERGRRSPPLGVARQLN